MRIETAETVALIGPNGAGKSTLLGALSGTVPRRSGQAILDGVDLMALPSHAIVALGVVQVPEGRHVFAPMTVQDNLLLGSVALAQRSRFLQQRFDAVYALFPRLAQRRQQLAGTLSGGEQQMVAIGRALMSQPRVLLLDEPFLGLAPMVVEEIRHALNILRQDGMTMILVEQKLDIALPFTSRTHVMIKGQLAWVQDSAQLMDSPDLAQLYFRLAQPLS
jgi:branched-chain amino acid transport system ATP-binding protein